jgi:phosphoglucosamine mutase
VGDRYVLEMMREKGCNVGGEQSGHVILLDHNTTGDGLQTALQLLCAMRDADLPVAELAADMPLYPQKLWNVTMPERRDVLADAVVRDLIGEAERKLDGLGRVNVRLSGTEPKLRIMVEAADADVMLEVGQALTDGVCTHLGI